MTSSAVLRHSQITAIMFVIVFAVGTDTFLVSPLLPDVSVAFGLSGSTGGSLIQAYALAYACSAVVLGPLSDRIGRIRLIQWGIGCFTIFTVLCGIAWNFGSLILFRTLSGVAAAAITPQVWALIGDLFPFGKRGRAMGIVAAALSVSQIAGVPFAALAAGRWGWRSAFVVLAGISAIGFLLVSIGIPQSRLPDKPKSTRTLRWDIVSNLSQACRSRQVLVGLSVMFCMSLGSLGMYAYLGLWLSQSFDMEVTGIGLSVIVVGIGNLLGNLSGGRLADRLGKRRTAMSFLVLMALCLILMPFASRTISLALSIIWTWQFGGGASLVSFNSLLSELAPEVRGTMMSLNNSAMYLGATAGITLNGYMLDHFSFVSAGWISGASVLLAAFGVSCIGRDT